LALFFYQQLFIVVRNRNGIIWEIMSRKIIRRKKRLYHRDKDGFYYIPETLQNEKKN